jgi:hypothetical protein
MSLFFRWLNIVWGTLEDSVPVHRRDSRIGMPEQRLQKCRAAYEPAITERDRVDAVIAAINKGWRPWHVNLAERRASAAYRITQAQKTHDNRSRCPRCLSDAYLTKGGMWHCDPCAMGWLPSGAKDERV